VTAPVLVCTFMMPTFVLALGAYGLRAITPSWAQDEAPIVKVRTKSPARGGQGKVFWSWRLLCKCHHILYCSCRGARCVVYSLGYVLLKLWAYCLCLNWDFRSQFFWVRRTHWTISSGCIRIRFSVIQHVSSKVRHFSIFLHILASRGSLGQSR